MSSTAFHQAAHDQEGSPPRRGPQAVILTLILTLAAAIMAPVTANAAPTTRYIIVLSGTATEDGFQSDSTAAMSLVASAGGTVTRDLSDQIGVLVVESASALFVDTLRSSPLVEEVGEDFKWKAFPTLDEAVSSGQLQVVQPPEDPGGGPEQTQDPLEAEQWSMKNIRAPQAHDIQAGSRLVEVGILDSGIDGAHLDFTLDEQGTNVNCPKGRDFVPLGPGLGNSNPCIDNQFHGTHVAGIVAAQANEHGVVGAAPNVTLVPVKVCDTLGYCYASSTAAGITYAGEAKLEVINMSFFVDDDVFLQSTEFKCMSDSTQRTFRLANERAIQYARQQGVTPVAALGNSDQDLAHPVDENGDPINNECEVVPAETQGVIGTSALGRVNEKSGYSNYGTGANDVAAPGGNFGILSDTPNEFCEEQVLSTIPGDLWGCFQGTSMASPHAAGVAALIVSEYGRIGNDSGDQDVVMRPTQVENYLQSTTIDQGLPGYDECFGNGRVDALRAVLHDTSRAYDASAPPCPEYEE